MCGSGLSSGDGVLRCARGHSFDVARQGYASLAPDRRAATGDDATMVAARDWFLRAGWYQPIADALVRAGGPVTAQGAVIDVGGGTGWYLAELLDAAPERAGLVLDASKYAARRAARSHPRAAAVVCDAWLGLPLRDGCAAVVLDVFAPRNGAETARVLGPGGALVVVTPTERHLRELADPLGLLDVDPDKEARLEAELSPHLTHEGREEVSFPLALDHIAVTALVAMGPSARHADPQLMRERITALPQPTEVCASVQVARWRA